ncbi:hypothetical protein BGZ94_006511 [Podila epigama]|nr:hypothetical protein BGZ94_006511 [Podila epigama]
MPRKNASGGRSITVGLNLHDKQLAMRQILDRLETLTDKSGRKVASLFVVLPDQNDYPDYYVAIQNPVALETIKARLEQGDYKDDNISQFGKDLKTMTLNAKTYNRHGSSIYKDALTLEKNIDEALEALSSDKSPDGQEPFSPAFCYRTWTAIRTLEDKSGRLLSELFLELPSREDYPDYYQEIARPIALDGIKKKIDAGEYPTLQTFMDDFLLMFSNAKQYNTKGSGIYQDAEKLKEFFLKTTGNPQLKPTTTKNAKATTVKSQSSNASSHPQKPASDLPSFVHQGDTYRIGDFVHLKTGEKPPRTVVGLIVNLWEKSGQHGFDATWFLRPDQFENPYGSQFAHAEVVKAIGSHEHPESDVIDKCFVLYPSVFVRGRPVQWKEGQAIYVCDQRYNEKRGTVTKIKNWPSVFPKTHVMEEIKLNLFSEPMVLTRIPSTTTAPPPAAKQSSEEAPSRQSTPNDSMFANSSVTPTTPTPASSTARKRKSAQISGTSVPTVTSSSHRSQVRCNYTNLATGTPCATQFSSVQELQQHVASEHAIVQNVAAPSNVKRGRPKKGASLDSTESSPQPQDATTVVAGNNSYHSQFGTQNPNEFYNQSSRPMSMPGAAHSTSAMYPAQRVPPGYPNAQFPQNQNMPHGMAHPSSYGHPGYGQPTPYGQPPYSQPFPNPHQRPAYGQPPSKAPLYDHPQPQQQRDPGAGPDYSNGAYFSGAYPYQQPQRQYAPPPSTFGTPYHATQPQPIHMSAAPHQGGISQYGHPQSYPHEEQRPPATHASASQYQQKPQHQMYPTTVPGQFQHSNAHPQEHFARGYQQQPVVQSQPLSSTSTGGVNPMYDQHYYQAHSQQKQQQQQHPHQYQQQYTHQHPRPSQHQHMRTMPGSSMPSTPPAPSSSRGMVMEGAGLGLTGVTISDHSRLTPTSSVGNDYIGSALPAPTTSHAGGNMMHQGSTNGHMAWSNNIQSPPVDYLNKRPKQGPNAYADTNHQMVPGGGPGKPFSNGLENGGMYAAAPSHHMGHGHTFSTSSMESVITGGPTGGRNEAASVSEANGN